MPRRASKKRSSSFQPAKRAKLEEDLFKQRTRLADAERTLLTKTTKAATESQRIATDRIAWIRGKLEDFNRTELKDRDSRIFPGQYAPVMVVENDQARGQADAISMSSRRQAGVLRHKISGHLQREKRQPRRLLERTLRIYTRRDVGARFMKTYRAIASKLVSWLKARKKKTSSSNSSQIRRRRC